MNVWVVMAVKEMKGGVVSVNLDCCSTADCTCTAVLAVSPAPEAPCQWVIPENHPYTQTQTDVMVQKPVSVDCPDS